MFIYSLFLWESDNSIKNFGPVSISRDSIVYYLPALLDNVKQSAVNNKKTNIIKKANALFNPS